MKKLFVIITLMGISYLAGAQACDKKACGPEGTKKGEAAAITTIRKELQTVVQKMSESSLRFDKSISEMEIIKGTTDDESLIYISQAATAIRYEMVNKIEPSKLVASLKGFKPVSSSNRQKMMAALKKEVEILVAQSEKL